MSLPPLRIGLTGGIGSGKSLVAGFFRELGAAVVDADAIAREVMAPGGPEPIELTHRLVMNFVTAKKLAEVLRVVVARHEQAFGVIEVDPNRRLRGQTR